MLKSKSLPILAGAAAALLLSSAAHADLVLEGGSIPASFTDLGAQGFGNAPRLLTLQTAGIETGSGTPVNVANGDAVPGANKTTTPTLSAVGWNSGNEVGIGFNSDQSGGTGITMQSLGLTIYNGTTALHTFSLAPGLAPLDFTATDLALQQGNGNAVFGFVLDAAEQTTFNNILATSGSSGFFAGLSSSLGCAAGAPTSCEPSNDGPDSFVGFVAPAPVIGHGLLVLLAIGGVLFGGKLFESLKMRRSLAT